MVQNKAFIFKSVPNGLPVPGKDLVIETQEFDLDKVPEGVGDAIVNQVVAKVLKSHNPRFKDGDWIRAYLPIQEYAVISKEYPEKGIQEIDNQYNLDLPVFVGPLGMPGITAWSSFYDIGKPQKGETIFISAASGAVGQIVGQLAKHEGLTVIGSVGSDEKLEFVIKELGFDAGFNYKKEKPADALERLAPKGIDIYYENVGGEHLEAAIDALNNFGRIIACGMIANYNLPAEQHYGIKNMIKFVGKRLTMRGFIQSDANMGPVYAKEHMEKLSKWLHDGTFKAKLDITEGIDHAAEGFVGMLEGKNFGKALLKIADEKE